MPRETDAADFLANEGSPEADRHLAENFGMTVRQVRDFDPQTLTRRAPANSWDFPRNGSTNWPPSRKHEQSGSSRSPGRRRT